MHRYKSHRNKVNNKIKYAHEPKSFSVGSNSVHMASFTDTNVVNSVVVDFSIETLARTLDPPLIAEFQHLTHV
jgi:hypothetical protein